MMEEFIGSLKPISRFMDRVQSLLALDFLDNYPPIIEKNDSPVRKETIKSATIATILGLQWGIHFSVGWFLLFNPTSHWDHQEKHKIRQAWTWCFYITSMCTFHLLEFFVTAFFNPNVVSSDSFLVNHSKAYTVAAILAGTEFWIRFCFFSSELESTTAKGLQSYLWTSITVLGIAMVVFSQIIRTFAMIKCGESFNHYIQTLKKDNHILVTDGIYSLLRHPSYVGFYYWALGTQLVLHNPISSFLFALAGWKFFSQRIPYEERSMIRLFGDRYYDYMMRSHVGIPFIPSIPTVDMINNEENDHQQQGFDVEIENSNTEGKFKKND